MNNMFPSSFRGKGALSFVSYRFYSLISCYIRTMKSRRLASMKPWLTRSANTASKCSYQK